MLTAPMARKRVADESRQRMERTDITNEGKEIVIGRTPPATSRGAADGSARRFNTNLAILARELVPPELLIEWHLGVLQNHDPHIVRDARCSSGWKVVWNESEMRPSLQDKANSINFLRQAGWGMPAQAHYVEAHVAQHGGDAGVDLSSLSGDVGRTFELVSALRLALDASKKRPVETSSEDQSDIEDAVVLSETISVNQSESD